MSEYYRLANGAQEVVNALNMAKSNHDKGLRQELKAEPETRVQTRIAERLKDSRKRIQEYRKRIRTIGNQPDSQENRDKIADLRFKMNKLVDKSVTKVHQLEDRLRP
jgi:predicted transcriptional regulator